MFCDDQVIGLIELDTAATWLPAEDGLVLEDLFCVLRGDPERPAQSTPFEVRQWRGKSVPDDGSRHVAVAADLQQLQDDLHATHQRLIDRFLSVGTVGE